MAMAGCEGRLAAPQQVAGAEPAPGTGAPDPRTGTESGTGDPGGGASERPEPTPDRPVFRCDEGTEPVPATLKRLTRGQYLRALEQLAAEAVGPGAARTLVTELPLERLPPDVLSEDQDHPTMVQAVGQSHVDGWHAIALRLGEAVSPDLAARCDDPDCIETEIRQLAETAFRRPPLPVETAFLADEVFGAAPDTEAGWSSVVSVLAESPDFLYRLEQGRDGTTAPGGRLLTGYELASRLAFHFWQAPPDAELLQAAASGELSTDSGYQAQVDRLFDDPRTRQAMHGFFEAWLELEAVPDMDANLDRDDFVAYAGDDLPGPNLTRELVADALAFVDHVTWDEGGSLSDLFTDPTAVPPSTAVARLYGLDAAPKEPVELEPTERAGILTRPALLAYNQAATRPIMRGARVRVRLLCEDLELPDNMDDIQIPEGTATQTTRDKVVELTEVPGSTCENCHRLLNPFGFALESFDALGRFRSTERFFDSDGQLVSEIPVHTASQTLLDGSVADFTDAVGMSRALSESRQMQACFARHYFRYAFGRKEDVVRDACVLESLRSRIAEGKPLAEVLKQVALEPEFRRVYEETTP